MSERIYFNDPRMFAETLSAPHYAKQILMYCLRINFSNNTFLFEMIPNCEFLLIDEFKSELEKSIKEKFSCDKFTFLYSIK